MYMHVYIYIYYMSSMTSEIWLTFFTRWVFMWVEGGSGVQSSYWGILGLNNYSMPSSSMISKLVRSIHHDMESTMELEMACTRRKRPNTSQILKLSHQHTLSKRCWHRQTFLTYLGFWFVGSIPSRVKPMTYQINSCLFLAGFRHY